MRQKTNSLFLSIIGHTAMLTLIGLQWNASLRPIHLGETTSTAIPSYVHQERVLSSPRREDKVRRSKPLVEKQQPSKQAIPLSQQKAAQPVETRQQNQPPSQKLPRSGNGKPISELVTLLHAAIQKQQQYPASAVQMEREGSATLMFVLFPNGRIQHLKMIKSSGTAALDEAALTAVNNALPFKGVDKYLAEPQTYQVSVAFELT